MEIDLNPRNTPRAAVNRTGNCCTLEIPAGARGTYRLAQLDDHAALARRHFRHTSPCTLNLRARVSAPDLPGTWGFGLWNDPFGFSLGFGGAAGRLPVLPNAAWFFHGSPPNWLSFHDGIPGNGFFAGVLRSPPIPSLLLSPALLGLPFLAFRPVSRLLRRLAGGLIRQAGAAITASVTEWHDYSVYWIRESVRFNLDGETILQTPISPLAPLGVVLWIDNQFAAWTPEGRLKYGTLDNPAAWLEIEFM